MKRNNSFVLSFALVLTPLLAMSVGCEGGGPLAPDPTDTGPPPISNPPPTTTPPPTGGGNGGGNAGGTLVTVTNVADDMPLANVIGTYNGADYVSDASGVIRFPQLANGARFDLKAEGFVTRNTCYDGTDFQESLIPDRPGLMDFIKEVVYRGGGTYIQHPSRKINIVPDPSLDRPDVWDTLSQAAALVTNANSQVVVEPGPGDGVAAVLKVAGGFFNANSGTSDNQGRSVITAIQISVPDYFGPKNMIRLAHEIAHGLGLPGHNPGMGIMYGGNGYDDRLSDFTEYEKIALRLVVRRRNNNRWPDVDDMCR